MPAAALRRPRPEDTRAHRLGRGCGSDCLAHHHVGSARTPVERKTGTFEQRHGAGMRPVAVPRRRRGVRLDEPAAASRDRGEDTVESSSGDTTPAVRHRGHKARDAPLGVRRERRYAPVEARGTGQRQFVRRAELTPTDRLFSVVHQDAVRLSRFDEVALLALVLDPREVTRRILAPGEVTAALVQHARAEGPAGPRSEQALEVRPRRGLQLASRVCHRATLLHGAAGIALARTAAALQVDRLGSYDQRMVETTPIIVCRERRIFWGAQGEEPKCTRALVTTVAARPCRVARLRRAREHGGAPNEAVTAPRTISRG